MAPLGRRREERHSGEEAAQQEREVCEMMGGDYTGGWWIIMWLSMAVFWSLVIVSVVMLVNSFGSNNKPDEDSPDETLRRRLATGEIDQEQYQVLSDEIHGRPHGPTAAVH